MSEETMSTADGNVSLTAASAQLTDINHDAPQDADIVQICRDRLKGNGAWNGQGLLVFLASTSRKDKERLWMEPLKDLCEKVVYADEDGQPMPVLTDADRVQIDELLAYSAAFHTALDER